MERNTNPDCKPEMEELMKDCPRSRSGAECWLRLCDIEDILGDNYDLDRLRELAEADREGRCMVVPSDYDGEMFKIWKGQILSSRRFVNNIKELGKTVFLTREEAQAALRREQE